MKNKVKNSEEIENQIIEGSEYRRKVRDVQNTEY